MSNEHLIALLKELNLLAENNSPFLEEKIQGIHKLYSQDAINQCGLKLYREIFVNLVKYNRHAEIQLFLQHGMEIVYRPNTYEFALFHVNTVETCQLLLDHARKQNKLYDLIQTHNRRGGHTYASCCTKNTIAVLEELMKIEGYQYYINMEMFLHAVCKAYVLYPAQRAYYHNLRNKIKLFIADNNMQRNRETPSITPNVVTAYEKLFGGGIIALRSIPDKVTAIKISLAEFYTVLNHEKACRPYLVFLNSELERYQMETYDEALPPLDQNYQFVRIDGRKFPIPNKNYKKIYKKSVLQAFLTAVFQPEGIAKEGRKLVGFVSYEDSKLIFLLGYMTTECRMGDGLTHGKVIHGVQAFILWCMLKNGELSISYLEDGMRKELNFAELTAGHMTTPLAGTPRKMAWYIIRDNAEENAFSNPVRFHEYVMRKGPKHGFPTLAKCMIDTFANGYLLQLKAQQEVASLDLTTGEYADLLNDMKLRYFGVSDEVIKYALKRDASMDRSLLVAHHQYGITRKQYTPNPKFVPRPYQNKRNEKTMILLRRSSPNVFSEVLALSKLMLSANEADCLAYLKTLISTGSKICSEMFTVFSFTTVDGSIIPINFLHVAIRSNWLQLLELFLQNGAHINIQYTTYEHSSKDLDWERLTPLLYALIYNQEEALKLLLKYKPNLLLTNQNGDNALMLAKSIGCCQLLIDAAISQGCLPQMLSQRCLNGDYAVNHMITVYGPAHSPYLVTLEKTALIQILNSNKTDAEVLRYLTKLMDRNKNARLSDWQIELKQGNLNVTCTLSIALKQLGYHETLVYLQSRELINPGAAHGLFAPVTMETCIEQNTCIQNSMR